MERLWDEPLERRVRMSNLPTQTPDRPWRSQGATLQLDGRSPPVNDEFETIGAFDMIEGIEEDSRTCFSATALSGGLL